ncbi:ImmA/IrrE family metallo-endopeptidase [Amycolatopsis sp. NPDC005003]
MKSKKKRRGSTFIDVDCFTWGPPDDVSPRHSIRRGNTPRSPLVEFSILHYLLRSQLILGLDYPKEGLPAYREFSEACALEARQLLSTWESVPNPGWLGDFRQNLKLSGVVDSHKVDDIGFSFILSPKIQAYSFPSEQLIEVSATSLVHLRTVNLLLCTAAGQLHQATGTLGEERKPDEVWDTEGWLEGENFVDFFLPHLFALYFPNVNYSSLPIPRTPDADILMRAKVGAFAQMDFMLAHECAHLFLHGDKKPSGELEQEADRFAFELCLDDENFWKNDQGTFFTFVRWFFLYLALDRIIGAVLSHYDIDWVDLPIRNRDRWLIDRVPDIKFASSQDRDCQFLGDLVLFQAKAKLYERGADWIRSAAKEFQKKHCFPGA